MDEKAHSNLGDELRELRQKARDMYPSAERLPTEARSFMHSLCGRPLSFKASRPTKQQS